jgi:hypothetical protein
MTVTRRLGHSATRAVLSGLVDYAGLFPPAGLGMPEAVQNFARYQRRDDHWALGRFVVPAARLEEFATARGELGPADLLGTRWPLTVLLGPDPDADLERVKQFSERHTHAGPEVLSLEAKAETEATVSALRRAVPVRYELFLYLPLDDRLPALAAAARAAAAGVKMRAGGVRPEDFPAPRAVLDFLSLSAHLCLPFKATAGLHHPLRGRAPLTYVPGADTVVMFGYLNLLAAAAAVWLQRPMAEAQEWLLADDRREFRLGPDGLQWRTFHLDAAALAATRREFMRSIGSCSFTEPLDEIGALTVGGA